MPINSPNTVKLINTIHNQNTIKNKLCQNLNHILINTLTQMINLQLDVDNINSNLYQNIIIKQANQLIQANTKYLMKWQHLTKLTANEFCHQIYLNELSKHQKIISTNFEQIMITHLIDESFIQQFLGEMIFKYDNIMLNHPNTNWLLTSNIDDYRLKTYLTISDLITNNIIKLLYQYSNL